MTGSEDSSRQTALLTARHRVCTELPAAGRYLLATTLVLAMICIMAANTGVALNVYADYFVTLSARPLAMGGTGAGLPDPTSVFYNPAGLANIRRLTLLYNHSARHFPGSQEGGPYEWDQLDGDTEAILVPLPLSTYAHGFCLSGELGYDYRGHPIDGSLGYPRQRYWGTEDYDAIATSTGLPLAFGIALRRSLGHFTPAAGDPTHVSWLRHGEGVQWGVLARVWPGLDYGRSALELDYDWTLLPPASDSDQGFPGFASETRLTRSGWALHPTGWLTLARDDVAEDFEFDGSSALGVADTVGLGTIHLGNVSRESRHGGGEMCLGTLAKLRWGSYDGRPTWGLALNTGYLWLNYAEVKSLLPEIIGSGKGFEDIHVYGGELILW